MPIHKYECKNPECKMEFEVFYTSIPKVELEEPEEQCPKCGSKDKEKLPPKGASFQLKGKGWYKDGYR